MRMPFYGREQASGVNSDTVEFFPLCYGLCDMHRWTVLPYFLPYVLPSVQRSM